MICPHQPQATHDTQLKNSHEANKHAQIFMQIATLSTQHLTASPFGYLMPNCNFVWPCHLLMVYTKF
jgi:hypothetical protein